MNYAYQSACGSQRQLVEWNQTANPKGVIQLVHGMAEYIDRYEDTAKYLNSRGYIVVGHNHPGHGKDAAIKGYFADRNGWDILLRDIHTVRELTQKRYPYLPYFLLGHSMGSFAVRCYSLKWEKGLSGIILSGTGHFDKPLLTAACGIANLQCMLGMGKKEAKLLGKMSSDGRNDHYKDVRTPFDWLSRDRIQVQKYMDDALCGFPFTVKGYRDMFMGLKCLYPEKLSEMERQVPILLFSGSEDPVGAYGVGVEKVAEEIKSAGVHDVTVHTFPQGRHEMFNEINRKESWALVADWMDRHSKK